MDRPLYPANEITPSKSKWTVLIQVFERRKPKKKDNGPLYRNYMVTDMQGTKVPLVMFDGNVSFFASTLAPFKRYYISNAIVRETKPEFKTVEYPYTWTIHRRHLIEPHHETIPPPLPCTFQLDAFADFYRFADQDRPVCIKALVIHAFPLRDTDESTSIRDFVVINEEMIPMLMRVWDDLLIDTNVNINVRYNMPALIIAYGMKITTHNGISLATKTTAYILHNPPVTEKHGLKEWYSTHATEIKALLDTRAYRNPSILFHPPTFAEIIPLNHALATIENVKIVWTEGKITYLPAQEKIWFEACEECLTALDVDTDWKIWCSVCQKLTNVIVRGTVDVFFSDGPTVVEGTIKSPDFEKIIPFTPSEMKLAAEKNIPLTKEIDAALENKHVICFLKYYDRTRRNIMVRHYPMLKIYTAAEVEAFAQAGQETAITDSQLEITPASEHIGSSSSAPQEQAEKQLFTPSTKAVLEEISDHPSLQQSNAAKPVAAKRMLSFQGIPPSETSDPIIHQSSSSLSPKQADTIEASLTSEAELQTTPSKKPRNKDRQL